MTNEEAKKNLLAYAYYVDEPMPPDVAKALDMAIKALEQPEPCEDTISRHATIDALRKMQTYKLFSGDDMILIDKAEVQTELMMLPPTESEPSQVARDIATILENEKDMRVIATQPETAKRIVGKSRGGMTLWYQCDMCNEPVDAQDNYCRGCGRRLIDG